MVGDHRPHFVISPENAHIRNTEFDGGGRTYNRADYYSHGQSLIQNIQQIQKKLASSIDTVNDRSFIEVRLAPDEKLKDRFKNLNQQSRIEVLDLVNESVGYASIKIEDIPLLQRRLKEYAESETHTGKSYFSFIEEIITIPTQERIAADIRTIIEENPSECIRVSIESFSSLPRSAQEFGIYAQVKRLVEEEEGKIEGSYVHSSGNVVIEAQLKASAVQKLIEQFDSIRSVAIASEITLPRTESFQGDFPEIQVAELEGNPVVCIFDTGINSQNKYLNNFVIGKHHAGEFLDLEPTLEFHDSDSEHANFVASRVVYRDNIQDQISSGELTPFSKVLDIKIFGKDAVGEDITLNESQLITVIRKTVALYSSNVRVYNLSLGFCNPKTDETALNDNQVSRLAAELDFLSKKHDILFVNSAGNINTVYEKISKLNYPNHFLEESTRITPPAECFLGLTVGSIATHSQSGSIASVNHPSPFSRRGPGFAGTRKPDLVCNGGNITLNGTPDNRIFCSALGRNFNELLYGVGTSYSTPIISSYAAELFDKLPDASTNLTKALLLHFSTHPKDTDTFKRSNKYEHLGFGAPELTHCLESLKSKATYIFEGSIAQQKYLKIPFWVPNFLTSTINRGSRKKLRLRITIVWDPLTDRRKFTDYSLIHLWPNLFKIGATGAEESVTLNSNGLELCSYKEKFYPVTRIEKQFERNFDGGLWALQLRMSHRWEVPEDYEQNFAAIISVEDPGNTLDVYQEIINQVGLRYPTLNQIQS